MRSGTAGHPELAAGAGDRRFDGRLLAAVVVAEAALLAAGVRLFPLLGSAALALGFLFLVFAFRYPDLAWALTFAAVPFSVERVLPFGAINLPSEPMIGLALAAWGLRCLYEGSLRVRPSTLHVPLLALATVALLSVLLGEHRLAGFKAWIVAAAYAAFGFLYFSATECGAARRERWVRLLAVVGGAWGAYGALHVLSLGVSLHNAYGAARPFFTEHGTYSAFLGMLLPLPLLEAMERRGAARWGFALAFLAIVLGILLSLTRAAWIATLLVLPAMLAVWARERRAWRRLLVPIVLIGCAVAGLAVLGVTSRLVRHARTVADAENVSNLERVNRWAAAWEMTKDRPWIGVGYGAYPDAYPKYRRKSLVTEQSYGHFGAHSEPLRLLSETGVTGFAAALWFLGAAGLLGLRAFRRAADPAAGRLALAILAGLATYAVHGLFNSYLGIDKVTAPFWMGLGALVALAPPGAAPRTRDP